MTHFISAGRKLPPSTWWNTWHNFTFSSITFVSLSKPADRRELENELKYTNKLVSSAKMVTDELFSLTQKTLSSVQKHPLFISFFFFKWMFSVPEESFPRFRRLYGFSWRAISWPPRVGISSRSGRGWEGSFATSGSCIFLLVLRCLRHLLLQGSSLDD